MKKTKAIKQTDSDQRQIEVAGRLQMVTRQDAEPAGIKRQRIVDSVFSAEVSDRGRGRDRSSEMKIGRWARVAHLRIKTAGQLPHPPCRRWIPSPFRTSK